MVRGTVTRYTPRVTIIDWNEADLPEQLRALPAGKYVIERADVALTPEEELGLIKALESVQAGNAVSHETARERVRQTVRR